MLREVIFILGFFIVSYNAFSYPDEEFFSLERKMKGVKMITEKKHNLKTVSYFNREGFLLREINYYKNNIRSDYKYEYSISDTLLEIRSINNDTEKYNTYKYYYNSLRQCYRFECYFFGDSLGVPFWLCDNFIYKNNQLQSYDIHEPNRNKDLYEKMIEITPEGSLFYYTYRTLFERVIYTYNENIQIKQVYLICADTAVINMTRYSIYQNDKLIDYIHENSEGAGAFMDVPCWNRKCDKVHIRVSYFDKQGNWKKSHFIQEKGKKFRSKRKIEYW